MKKQHFTEGTWKGLPNYQCAYCAYAAAGDHGLTRIKRHIAGHFAEVVAQPADREAAVLDFASDEAADEFTALPAGRREAVAIALINREPSGLTGYTVADVRAATNEED